MIRIAVVLLLLPLAFLSSANDLEKFNEEFRQFFDNALKEKQIPGAAYVLVQQNRIVDTHTFGHTDTSKKQKITKNSVFRLASVSKTFAATLAAIQVANKKLSWQDPVTKYVPEFQLAKAGAADKIKIKHILSHSTGLTPNAYDNLLNAHVPLNKIVPKFEKLSPICAPEQCYGYQNIAYSFIEPAIEANTNLSYAQLLQTSLLTPLNMNSSSIGLTAFLASPNKVTPHVLMKRKNTGRFNTHGEKIYQHSWKAVDVNNDYYQVEAAAGVNASIEDLGKWLIANMGYNPSVLPKEIIAEVTTPRTKTQKDLSRLYWRGHLTEAHYGYGWRIYQFDGHPLIYHSGWVSGFRADIAYSPELKIGFAVLMNAEANVINKISAQFWQDVFKTTAKK